jgi:protein-disulfide isomerase
VLRAAGLDTQAIDADIASHKQQYNEQIARHQRETAELGVHGTPGLIVGDQLALGSINLAELERLVAQARERR